MSVAESVSRGGGDQLSGSASPWLQSVLADSRSHGLSYVDLAPFLNSSFDPQEYANAIIDAPTATQAQARATDRQAEGSAAALLAATSATKASAGALPAAGAAQTQEREHWLPQPGRRMEGDLSVALGRLSMAIDDVERMTRDEVTRNAPVLLSHTTTLLEFRPTLATLSSALETLDQHQAKLVARISAPQRALQSQTLRLARMRRAQALVRHAQRLVRLLRRLHTQMQALGSRRAQNGVEKLGEEGGAEEDVEATAAMTLEEAFDVVDAGDEEQAGRGLSRAALTVAEITLLLHTPAESPNAQQKTSDGVENTEATPSKAASSSSLLNLAFVQECMPMLEQARERVTDLMEDMIVRGLRDLSPTLLSTSLQTAYNLGQLTDLVRDLLADLTDVVRDRVRAAFDMQSLARELGTNEPHVQASATTYRARRGVETPSTVSQRWKNAIWARLETLLIGEMGAVCSKVYTLERVLSLKNDPVTRINFLNSALNVLGDRPSAMFWSTLGNSIEQETRRSNSPFLVQTLEQGYPRLLRIFQDFYAKVSVYTGTTYSHAQQSPETLIIMRSLARFEGNFLAKCSSRFATLISSSFDSPRSTPGPKDATALTRVAQGELDAAREDPLLLHAVGKIVCERLAEAKRRLEGMIVREALIQPFAAQVALSSTQQQSQQQQQQQQEQQQQQMSAWHSQNAALAGALHHLALGIQRTAEQGPIEFKDKLTELHDGSQQVLLRTLIEPQTQAICKEVSDVMSRMHYVDFSLDRDAVSGSGSAYMADLSDRMWFVREQLLVRYDVPTGPMLLRIAKHALHQFVMHASLLRPLAEGGKLKLTSDMTELEFSISQLLASAHHTAAPLTMQNCGKEFKALRTFRHLLFMDVTQWSAPSEELQAGLAPMAAAHHVIGRSRTIAWPYELHSWSRGEYMRWLEEHTVSDGVQLVQGCLDAWRGGTLREGNEAGQQTHDDEVLAACVERIIAASKKLADNAAEPV